MAETSPELFTTEEPVATTTHTEQPHGGDAGHAEPELWGFAPYQWVSISMLVLLLIAFFGAKVHKTITGGLDGQIAAIREELDEAKRLRAEAEKLRDEAIVAEIRAITDEFERYGYRRVGAELRHRGHVVNAKKVRRLMKAHDLNPRPRRRFVRTTDSDHNGPIFPLVARDFEVHGPDQLWVADLTYITVAAGFAYVALILDAWSRRVCGW